MVSPSLLSSFNGIGLPVRMKFVFFTPVNRLTTRGLPHEPEDPLARGFWGKPSSLLEAKNDFLCLRATLSSTRQSADSITLGKFVF